MTIRLWQFPESDFPAWRELVGESECETFADYMSLLAAVQADQERQGRTVARVKMTVSEMRQRLNELILTNTPDNRALVLAMQ